ncbi:GGDEF domain-containing protein [Asanoa sp. WMMD1127]|uniref:GGDEF domain-containing protein n=1 Tax=Asanoa sp. WMMD1127 TaxID=3016107 RepID=UPI0024167FE5|nr:GGDEF domain-containing protein [Asanoa sp. WMMD1127]MDG4823309.1 GGDEF domain-containing protein [Asanoa sp. WMMD1127]
MGWLDRVPDQVDALRQARALMMQSRSADACVVLDRVLETTAEPNTRADALIQRLSAVLNLGRTAEYAAAVDRALECAREAGDPYLIGHAHALAALAAHHQGALDRCVTHFVQSASHLARVQDPDGDTAWGWHDLAMAYSYLSFHGYALGAIERARQIGASTGLPEELFAAPGIRLRNAVALDHSGDSDGCLRVLRDIGVDLCRFLEADGGARLRPSTITAYGYAAARRGALGEDLDDDVSALLAAGGDGARARDLRQLGDVCLAIAEGRPIEALARLGTITISPQTLGAAEPERLRSLIYARAGDHAAAHRADRKAFRLAAQRSDRLQTVYVDGIAAQIEREELRRTAMQLAGEALTDPLTGLPNRRQLERYVAAMVARGEAAVIGVCDLDGFKAVNTEHGHHSGDLVLQRIAGVIHRVMRRGDFVARYGGDEFVVVLPGAGMAEAADVARRIGAAVAAEDWQALVPGTPVGVSVGFAEVKGSGPALRDALGQAFEIADREMLRAKRRPRAAS